MQKNYNDISHIESYLRGEMDADDRRAFEAQLTTDESLRSEVAAYRQIFTGFDALQEESFATDVAKWTAAAKAKGDDGKIVPIKRRATVWSVLQQVAVAASVVLLLGFGAAWWGSNQYSNTALVKNAYVAPLSGGTMGETNILVTEVDRMFEKAHRQFQDGNYEEASKEFENITATLERNADNFDPLTIQSWLKNANWTGLLAKFVSGQISEEQFKLELEAIAKDTSSEYAAKAQKLRGDLDSIWRRF